MRLPQMTSWDLSIVQWKELNKITPAVQDMLRKTLINIFPVIKNINDLRVYDISGFFVYIPIITSLT